MVACGACWERAIRDDERVVVECGLPREITPDPSYVDQIAVDLACRGERVSLTRREFRVAVARLHGRRLPVTAIARRLSTSHQAVLEALPGRLPLRRRLRSVPAGGEVAA
jgi:hypothetical protein